LTASDNITPWQQGDIFWTSDIPFVHFADANKPLSDEAKLAIQNIPANESTLDLRLIEIECVGYVILTQTCDLVRSPKDRPYLEISPIIQATKEICDLSRKQRIPRYVSLQPLEKNNYVADLDRKMTIEKSILGNMKKCIGCKTDKEKENFSRALTRKSSRFAFPNDFNNCLQDIQKRIKAKHGKLSPEGQLLSDMREIKVIAKPNWSADNINIVFYVIFPEDVELTDEMKFAAHELINKFQTNNRFEDFECIVLSIANMSAAIYLNSQQIDFDHLSA
jgi:hypothetical protein